MVVRWIFDDPVTLASYTVPVNPNRGGTPTFNKNLQFTNTAGPNGNVLVFEGRDEVKQMQVSGTILDQAHLDTLQAWAEKRYQLQVTDDLGRVFNIYITGFDAHSVRARSHPYQHEYTLTYIIVDW